MGVFTYPLDAVSGAPSYTGEILRQTLSALAGFAPSGRPLGADSGVRRGTPTTTVSVTGSGPYTWNCAAHSGVLDLETSATAGPYLYAVSTNQSGTITAADATNPRIDIVYVQLSDPAEGDGSTTPQSQVLYLAGTAAASPSAPATPARSIVLAQLNVPKSGTGAPTATWTAPIFGAQYTWQARRDAAQSFSSGSFGTVLLDTIEVDPAGIGITTSGSYLGGFKCPVKGVYACSGGVGFASNATGRRGTLYQVNATAVTSSKTLQAASAAGALVVPAKASLVSANAGDVISLQAFQDSGGSLGLTTSDSVLSVQLVQRL